MRCTPLFLACFLAFTLCGPLPARAADAAAKTAVAAPAQETGYWLNTKSNVRHNQKCRYYGKGKNGRPATATEGKACKVCGG